MERIKQHCVNCAPDHKVDECNGHIIGAQARMHMAAGCARGPDGAYGVTAICPIFPYRFGKNPNRQAAATKRGFGNTGIGTRFQKKQPLAALECPTEP